MIYHYSTTFSITSGFMQASAQHWYDFSRNIPWLLNAAVACLASQLNISNDMNYYHLFKNTFFSAYIPRSHRSPRHIRMCPLLIGCNYSIWKMLMYALRGISNILASSLKRVTSNCRIFFSPFWFWLMKCGAAGKRLLWVFHQAASVTGPSVWF